MTVRQLPAAVIAVCLAAASANAQELPADGSAALEHLSESPRHGEWITYDAGEGDEVSAWLVYPERNDAAPVVVVIHEIFGMSDWVRSVADQLAGEGFIAIAPDLLSGKGADGGGTESLGDGVGQAIRDLDRSEINRRLKAAAEYATALPATTDRVGSVGFCWGGQASFEFAVSYPELDAAVVYYGTSPATETLTRIQAPVLGFYGGNDNRVAATVPAAREEMARLGKEYRPIILEGAGHGFLRAQDGQDGANMEATRQAWPETLAFFRERLE